MRTYHFDDLNISDKAVKVIDKYKDVLESLSDIIQDPQPDDNIEEIIRSDIAPVDQELITAFIDMAISMSKFLLIANREET